MYPETVRKQMIVIGSLSLLSQAPGSAGLRRLGLGFVFVFLCRGFNP